MITGVLNQVRRKDARECNTVFKSVCQWGMESVMLDIEVWECYALEYVAQAWFPELNPYEERVSDRTQIQESRTSSSKDACKSEWQMTGKNIESC